MLSSAQHPSRARLRLSTRLNSCFHSRPLLSRLGDQQKKGAWDEEETERLRKAVEDYLAAKAAAEQGGSQGEALIAMGDDAGACLPPWACMWAGSCCIGILMWNGPVSKLWHSAALLCIVHGLCVVVLLGRARHQLADLQPCNTCPALCRGRRNHQRHKQQWRTGQQRAAAA